MQYYLQGGITRSKKFDSERAAKRHLNEFLQHVRLNKVRLKNENGNLVAIYVHEKSFLSSKEQRTLRNGWNQYVRTTGLSLVVPS